jgi:predicted membrane protein
MLKFLFIFALIVIFFRVFGKYILAGIIMLIVPKIMKKAAQQQNNEHTIFTNGNVKVDKSKSKKDNSEYTDYEVVE